jgi:16S rRNA (uracil1498-N3)-methyltransferase
VNILILAPEEIGARIARGDRRWEHVKKVLRKGPGDRISAGLACGADGPAGGALGEAVIRELDREGLVLDFEAYPGPAGVPPALAPLILILGFPRPIQAARILKDLTSLGVSEIHLTGTELGEKSYAQSSIFRDRDFRACLIEGAEQAGNPRLPRVLTHWSLRLCLEALAAEAAPRGAPGERLFLHPYGDHERLGAASALRQPVTLAVGSERGWTDAEVLALRAAGFSGRSLGGRILKTETAAIAACALALAGLQLL